MSRILAKVGRKRPTKSFPDLEVYQKTYGLVVGVVGRVAADFGRSSGRQFQKGRGGQKQAKIEADYFEEQIKEYLRVRGKILRLQRSWLKFMAQKVSPN